MDPTASALMTLSPPSAATMLAAVVIGYLLGAIPFGLILTRAAGLGDVRKIGSGNIGATNVLRTGNKGIAAATLLLDMAKGAAAVLIGSRLLGDAAAIAAGFGALLGHIFPVWLGFKGGKGVSTYVGVLLGLVWQAAAVFALVWIVVAAATRISSLSGLIAIVAAPFAAYVWATPSVAVAVALMSVLVIFKHRDNIRRLVAGEEPRIGGGT